MCKKFKKIVHKLSNPKFCAVVPLIIKQSLFLRVEIFTSNLVPSSNENLLPYLYFYLSYTTA